MRQRTLLAFVAAVPLMVSALAARSTASGADGPTQQPGAVCSTTAQGDLTRARSLYDRALATNNPSQQIAYLEQSLSERASFEASYRLGEALLAQKAFRGARSCFTLALGQAATPEAGARAAAQIGESYGGLGCEADRINWLKQSLARHRYPAVEKALANAINQNSGGVSGVVRAPAIRQALGRCDASDGATRSFGVEASIDLRINFAYDRADLTDQGLEQARELGRALTGSELSGKSISLVGHTDARGEADYNERLSLQRAESVKALLVREFGIPSARVATEGRGERNPLLSGASENDYAVNRRVEVVVR